MRINVQNIDQGCVGLVIPNLPISEHSRLRRGENTFLINHRILQYGTFQIYPVKNEVFSLIVLRSLVLGNRD